MGVNLDQPQRWKRDIEQSVDMYNQWFVKFAPSAFRDTREQCTQVVEDSLAFTDHMRAATPDKLVANPGILPTLRMTTSPPLAVDRLIGLSGATPNVVKSLEKGRLPGRMPEAMLMTELAKITATLQRMTDSDVFPWLHKGVPPTEPEIHRAATIVADRLCGSAANPIIRNAQETRQLAVLKAWLEARGYREVPLVKRADFRKMDPGTFAFRLVVPVETGKRKPVKIPVDAVIMPLHAAPGTLPLLVEAKSAGDFANPNKRRKEEAKKMQQLRAAYGANVQFVLLLCGYFNVAYLEYEADEGIDWVWEHRIDDFVQMGL